MKLEEKEKFVKRYGHNWYLRDFDYLPERLEDCPHNLSMTYMKILMEGKKAIIFETREDAIEASNKVREVLGLEKFNL